MFKLLVEQKLSENKYFTPEGYLLCKDAVIARTGYQQYTTNDLNEPDLIFINNKIQVFRNEDELFSDETIASFNLKSFTLEHPSEEISPENWKDYTIGIIQNVRGKEGLLLADILITDKDVIQLVLDNKIKGLSCGYNCDYKSTGDGTAIQTNIRGNHVSLVKYPRGGSVCTIQDSINQKDVIDLEDRLYKILIKNYS